MIPATMPRLSHPLLATLLIGLIVAVQAAVLLAMGQPAICDCGHVAFWYPLTTGPETSQHLTDWYTFTHVLHGLIFYLVLRLALAQTSFPVRLTLALAIEAAWEIVENTPAIIDRYRETAIAQGYFGDSVVNSLVDTAVAALGFLLARVLPVWASTLLFVALELILAWMIRDNLTLNILQLVWPTEAVSNWQVGG
jgi:hypothetical protein